MNSCTVSWVTDVVYTRRPPSCLRLWGSSGIMLLAPVKGFVNCCILRDEWCGLVTAGMYYALVQIALNGLGGSIGMEMVVLLA
jgi:hypothetical protein